MPPTSSTDDTSALQPSQLDFPVVGLGASAGGIVALQQFFSHVPADCGMAFVVVLHLMPSHPSHLAEVLQTVTALPVSCPEGPVSIERGHVYVIAPNKLLVMNDSMLSVSDLARSRGRPATIDLFFRTLAVVHRERAFAVVLSGSGSDGAVGLARIKEEGGITFAQAPQEAEFGDMPRAAIATGVVDWILPVDAIPAKLVELWRNAREIRLPAGSDGARIPGATAAPDTSADAEEALREVLALLHGRTGHDFRNYKRATVLRRIERRMQVHGLPDLPSYRTFMQAHADEGAALLKDLLIGVTNFFRDNEAFEALRRDVLPSLMESGPEAHEGLRVWVPGCSTGEEAYSLAILLCEEIAQQGHARSLHLFATDIDEAAIGVARLGVYPSAIEADVAEPRLRRWFEREGNQYRIRKEVRETVMFAAHDILRDPPFSRLDLISCRNLLIYLNREVHAEILEMFHFALKPGGYLFLGSSESADTASHLFSLVDKKNRIFRANVVSRPTRYVPAITSGPSWSRPSLPGAELPPRKPVPSIADLHHRLAEQYAPPSVLVDRDGRIVHLSDRVGRFLRYAAGEPSNELLDVVLPELRLELRTALFQAASTGKSVEARRVHLVSEGLGRYVNMTVRPVAEADADHPLTMVLIDEVDDTMAPDAQAAPGAEGRDPVVTQLEGELRRAKEQLQNTVEQYDTSTEELKASNEELQAINEELITVNHELKCKVEETGKINDDLQNLIASTDIATVFVDRAMCIKRYTPQARRVFNLIASDVGRSLLDITHRLDYEDLAQDATDAFQSLRQIEREVRSQDGTWYLARVLPYRTTEDRIDGAVLTFVDITSRRRAEDTMRLVADSLRDYAIFTLDPEGIVTSWTPGAERLFGRAEAEMLGQSVTLLYTPEDVSSGVPQALMQRARVEGRAEGEGWRLRQDGSRVLCHGIVTPLVERDHLRGYGVLTSEVGMLFHERRRRAGAEDAESAAAVQELRNPLHVIQLNAEVLLRSPEAQASPSLMRAVESIRGAVLSQAQALDEMLERSRPGRALMAGRRVLLVSGDAGSADALRQLLTMEGLEVDTIASPDQARARGGPTPDVLLGDLHQPDGEPGAWLAALRAQPALATVPAIAIGGQGGREDDAARASAAGFSAFLEKPVSVAQLVQALGGLLKDRGVDGPADGPVAAGA